MWGSQSWPACGQDCLAGLPAPQLRIYATNFSCRTLETYNPCRSSSTMIENPGIKSVVIASAPRRVKLRCAPYTSPQREQPDLDRSRLDSLSCQGKRNDGTMGPYANARYRWLNPPSTA